MTIKSFDPDLPDDEPEYTEDVFGDRAWRKPDSDFQRKLLASCGRKYFRTKGIANKVKSLERQTQGKTPKYPPAYVEGLRKWAEDKNKFGIVITFDTLLGAIRDVDRLTKYKQKNKLVSSYDESERIMNERNDITSDTE